MTVSILRGHVLDRLRELPDESVHCCVTSPPYYGLRDYGTAKWVGGSDVCDHRSPTMREGRNEDRAKLAGSPATNSAQLLLAHRSVCGKCGAVKQDGQLGLEPTLDEYIANMVAVFREVRRVLRSDGTLWLNIGDSYAARIRQTKPETAGAISASSRGVLIDHQRPLPPGFKEKDLMGVPWRLAQALQRPYYVGTIKEEIDRVWLASMIDGEGCIYIHKRGVGLHAGDGYMRKSDTYAPGLQVANCYESIVLRCQQITGVGTINHSTRDGQRKCFRWMVNSNEARQVLREVYPYLVGKQQQARIAFGVPNSGSKAEAAWAALKLLHKGHDSVVDDAPPPACTESGWYLRSEIIWAKKSCMPESVRDRPTKSHEHIFLLAKSERYYYDQAAASEPAVHAGRVVEYDGTQKNSAAAADQKMATRVNHTVEVKADRNWRDVWSLGPEPFKEAHFATFPTEIPRRAIVAGTSEKGCCASCGAPWGRSVEREFIPQQDVSAERGVRGADGQKPLDASNGNQGYPRGTTTIATVGWEPSCSCETKETAPAVVLDPFLGSGTTALVADRLQRDCIGIELNPAYADMAERRIRSASPLFAEVSA